MILDVDGQPLQAATRRPIQARHITRVAIWTQEMERRIRQEHSAEGYHNTGFHAIGGVWFQINDAGQPMTIGPQSFWRDQVQRSAPGIWSGQSIGTADVGRLDLGSGGPIPEEAMLIMHARNLTHVQRTYATRLDATSVQVNHLNPGHEWLMLLIYGV